MRCLMRRTTCTGVILLLVLAPWPAAAVSAPAVRGTGGAVTSAHPLATEVGLATLEAGGNAADAAVATALALAVVFPQAGNLGGGGFAVGRLDGELWSLDFRETAPAAATRDMYLDAEGNPLLGASLVGPLAAGVPGSPAGLYALHGRFGRLPWARVVEPARRLAAGGFPVNQDLAATLTLHRLLLSRFPETAAVWLPGGSPLEAGTVLALPELAATLEAYAAEGPEAITAGPRARAVEEASRRHGGILTAADLAAYEPVWRRPLTFSAFGWELAAMPLPSAGGIALAQGTGLLERLGWAELPRHGAGRAHLLVETLRRVYADRFLLGDPESSGAQAEDLLATEWLARRAASVDRRQATPSGEVHPWPGEAPEGAETGAEPADTTQISVVDAEGGLVALTTTLNGLFGCGLYVPEAGFLLNNEMDDFAAAPGRPNLYGLIQGEANAVHAGRRMLSSMAPTLAFRGEEALALGGRGGSRIPTALLQVLLHLLVDGDGLQKAVDRPRLHHQWLPDEVWAEEGALAPETREALESRGHSVTAYPRVARIRAVRLLPDGTVEAASDPRGPGATGVAHPLPGEPDRRIRLPPPREPEPQALTRQEPEPAGKEATGRP